VAKLKPEDRASAESAAKPWLAPPQRPN
jgi:hypothetical protein